MKQYVGEDLKTFVPRVIGQTAEAQQKKTAAIRGGKQYGTFSPTLDYKGGEHKPIQIWTDASLSLWLGDIMGKLPLGDEPKRLQFLRRLNEITGVAIPDGAISKYPSIPSSVLNNEAALNQFLETLDWFVQEVEAS